MRKRNNKKKLVTNIIFNIVALVSTLAALVFCFYIYKLDILPSKYLTIAFGAIGIIYLILICLTLPRKIKIIVKGICCFFFVINLIAFSFGIKFSDKTIDFLDKISYDLSQKEDYDIKVLKGSKIKDQNDLNSKKIGVFKNDNYDELIKILKKSLQNVEIIDYEDPVKFFEDLESGKIDAVIASNTVYNLLEDDLSYMKLELVNAHVVGVPIKGEVNEVVKVVDVTNTPFNIYIAGGDKTGSINTVMNTDVNMIVSVDPVNHKLLLTSIPRDYYVLLPGKGEDAYDKLTHAGYYGVQESIRAVENLLDIEINYYAKVNFTTIINMVEALGGIDVESDYSFTEDNSHHYYRFKKGTNHMNGWQALAFARERNAFHDGDVQRVKNQQKVIDAMIKKMSSSTELIKNYEKILGAIKSSFATNLDGDSIRRLIKLQLNDMRGWSSESQNLVGHGDMSTKCYSLKGWNLYVMKQDADSVKKNSDKIKEFLGIKISENDDSDKQ